MRFVLKTQIYITVKEAIFIISLIVPIAFIVNAFRSDGIVLLKQVALEEEIQPEAQMGNGFHEISINQAITLYNEKKAIFVDSRSQADYNLGHIEGAVNIPDHSFEVYIDLFLTKTPPDQIIITYCDGPTCPLGKQLAEKLFYCGFEHVFYLMDGYSQWQLTNMPIDK